MTQQSDVPGTGFRFLVLFGVLGLSICRLLVRHDYGFLNPEVCVIMGVVAAICGTLALVTGKRAPFGVVVMLLIVSLSLGVIQPDLLPTVRYRWIFLGLTSTLGTAMYFMGSNFYKFLLVFVVSSFGVEVIQATIRITRGPQPAKAAKNPELRHVLHLILDEHIGLRGFPDEIPECQKAKAQLLDVLQSNNFRIYPNAFSNYLSSWDSIPSILNGELLDHTGFFLRQDPINPIVLQNRLFERYLAEGYAIKVYQSDYISFASPKYPAVVTQSYMGNKLAALHQARLGWLTRLRNILVVYFQSNRFLWGAYTRLTPTRYHFRSLPLWPLSLAPLWPNTILADIQAAEQKTLFFAHLLIPHFPYTFGPNGEVTDASQWSSERELGRYDRGEYVSAYQRYAGQVQFLTRQLASVFQMINDFGLYDSLTIILHGDHGSRIRFLNRNERVAREKLLDSTSVTPRVSRYDYVSKPQLQDLLNRFSILLAVKPPGATEPLIIEKKGSILSLLWSEAMSLVDVSVKESDTNYVFLFDARGLPRKIDILRIWEEEEMKTP